MNLRASIHAHRYNVVDVQTAPSGAFGPVQTIVLERCRCGNLRTYALSGRWSRNQALGYSEPTAAS